MPASDPCSSLRTGWLAASTLRRTVRPSICLAFFACFSMSNCSASCLASEGGGSSSVHRTPFLQHAVRGDLQTNGLAVIFGQDNQKRAVSESKPFPITQTTAPGRQSKVMRFCSSLFVARPCPPKFTTSAPRHRSGTTPKSSADSRVTLISFRRVGAVRFARETQKTSRAEQNRQTPDTSSRHGKSLLVKYPAHAVCRCCVCPKTDNPHRRHTACAGYVFLQSKFLRSRGDSTVSLRDRQCVRPHVWVGCLTWGLLQDSHPTGKLRALNLEKIIPSSMEKERPLMAPKVFRLSIVSLDRFPRSASGPPSTAAAAGVRESLEGQTMGMAKGVAKLISETVRHACGAPVECVIADTCIGGVAEAAQTAEKFAREGVGVSLTVSPCWCYGSETMDMDPLTPKAVWGFNGTERPGAVYLAAVLAGHNQKGLPAFGIYGRDVQDKDDTTIPADVRQKILSFVRARPGRGHHARQVLSLAGQRLDGHRRLAGEPRLLRALPRHEGRNGREVEFVRRIEQKIFDEAEYQRAAGLGQGQLQGRRRSQRERS